MARVLDPEAHAVRRDSFVDAAQRLIQSKGYEQLSVQDVLDQLGASKGAFYHYFDSKQALLEAVVVRMVDVVATALTPMALDPAIPAAQKINAFFSGFSQYKSARQALMMEILKTWISDDNALVREKLRRAVAARLTPLLAAIVRQGNAEGVFSAGSPDHAAVVLVSLILGLNEKATELFVARQAETISLEDVERTIYAYVEAFERVLGAPTGSLVLTDPETVRLWFD
jgi:AcrR family transcriptional regulator